jgi:F0F1-type ATP synthase assembly protein I
MLESSAVTQKPGPDRTPRILTESQIAGLTAQSGCLVVGLVLIAVVLGIWLDRLLNTRPLITLALVLGSMPLTIYLLFRIAMRATAAGRQAAPRAEKDRNDHDPEA